MSKKFKDWELFKPPKQDWISKKSKKKSINNKPGEQKVDSIKIALECDYCHRTSTYNISFPKKSTGSTKNRKTKKKKEPDYNKIGWFVIGGIVGLLLGLAL